MGTFGFEFFFGVTDRSHFRVGVDHSRNGIVVDMRVLPCDAFNCEDTLIFGFVGQHGSSDNVTYGQNILDVGLKVVIDDDSAFVVDFDACFVEVETGCVRFTASGYEDVLSFEGLLVAAFDRFDKYLSMVTVVFAAGYFS